MSIALVRTRAAIGLSAPLVTVEVHQSNGLPALTIVGLPEAAVRESKDRIDVYDGPRRVASHRRVPESIDARVTDLEHRPPRHEGFFVRQTPNEERRLTERVPEAAAYVAVLRRRGRGSLRDLRVLLRMSDDYPRAALIAALVEATHYGMADLERLERMVLRRIARDFFNDPNEGSS